jgi:hypothetical protein
VHAWQLTPPMPQVATVDVWHLPLASQQPLHELLSHTHCPPLLQCWPDAQIPSSPVQSPPAPSDPPQATPTQPGALQTPWSFSKPLSQVAARQLPAPSHIAVAA